MKVYGFLKDVLGANRVTSARRKLIESGSHDELMAQNGKYAEMFLLQAEKYRTA